MTTHMTRRALLFTLPLAGSAVAARKPTPDARKEFPIPVAIYAQGPSDDVLSDYATMLKAYVVPVTLDHPVVFEIDYIANQSGVDKDVPADLSSWVRSVLERIGDPFETYRTWPSIAGSAHGNVLLGPHGPDRPKPPVPSFRVVGVLSGFKETLVNNKNHKLDIAFGGGDTSTNIQAALDRTRTVTTLSVSLTLERPDTVAVRGTTVDYEIDIAKDEKNRSIGLYVGGSGIGVGAKLTASQNTSDMMREAVAMAVIHMTAAAFQVPYYRCSPSFSKNERLDKSVNRAFATLGDGQLEDSIRRYLFLAGKDVNPGGPVSAAERAVIRAEMTRRSLADNHEGRVEMAMQLWRTLDYHKAAERVDDLLVARQRQMNGAAARNAGNRGQQQPPPPPPPADAGLTAAEFGWPAYVRFVALDLSNIPDAAARNAVIRTAAACEGCYEVRPHRNPALFGLRLSSSPAEVDKALKRSGLAIRYSWAGPNRLVVAPAQ